MKRLASIFVAGFGGMCLFAGCTHTHRLDGVEVGEPAKPPIVAPLQLPLNEQGVVQAAEREAARLRVSLQECKGPDVLRPVSGGDRWCVFYRCGLYPGGDFMFVVNARTGETKFVPGE